MISGQSDIEEGKRVFAVFMLNGEFYGWMDGWMDGCCLGNLEMFLNVLFRTTRSRRYHRQTVSTIWERMYYLPGQTAQNVP